MRECGGRLAEGSAAVQQAEIERKLLQDYQKQAQRDREQLQRWCKDFASVIHPSLHPCLVIHTESWVKSYRRVTPGRRLYW